MSHFLSTLPLLLLVTARQVSQDKNKMLAELAEYLEENPNGPRLGKSSTRA